MLGGLLFGFWRLAEIVTLIPVIGMLAYFVNLDTNANKLTPASILVLFIVSVLACAWAVATLLRLGSTRRSALFVAFIDLCFVGALIAGVYYLRGILKANCSSLGGSIYINLGNFGSSSTNAFDHVNKYCAMQKASEVFGIMNIIFFFITFILALFLHRHQQTVVVKETRTRRHSSRRGNSGSRSRRSSSRRRNYYV